MKIIDFIKKHWYFIALLISISLYVVKKIVKNKKGIIMTKEGIILSKPGFFNDDD